MEEFTSVQPEVGGWCFFKALTNKLVSKSILQHYCQDIFIAFEFLNALCFAVGYSKPKATRFVCKAKCVSTTCFLAHSLVSGITQKGFGLMEGCKEGRKDRRKFSPSCYTSSFTFRTKNHTYTAYNSIFIPLTQGSSHFLSPTICSK